MEDKCTRCGRCCHFIDSKGNIAQCKYLIKLGNKTFCRIYPNRLGTKITKKYTCTMREKCPNNFKDCPYNRSDQEERDVGY